MSISDIEKMQNNWNFSYTSSGNVKYSLVNTLRQDIYEKCLYSSLMTASVAGYGILGWEIFSRFWRHCSNFSFFFKLSWIYLCLFCWTLILTENTGLSTWEIFLFYVFDFLTSVFFFFSLELRIFRNWTFQTDPLIVLSFLLSIYILLYFLSSFS